MKTIESYLPIFQGFYGTYFACECDGDVLEEEGVLYEEVKFDYADYNKRVAQACISSVWNYLKHDGFEIDIEFEKVYSPREYNFENDVIYCTYKVSNEDFEKLVKYCETNLEEFTEYLKENFSSHDGFYSFFETDPDTWFLEYLEEEDGKFERAFANILKFYLENEGYTVDDMLSDAQHEISNISYEVLV